MPNTVHHGIPAARGPLAATAFAAPAIDTRVTIVPDLPLVPVRAVVAAALAADRTARDIVWAEPARRAARRPRGLGRHPRRARRRHRVAARGRAG